MNTMRFTKYLKLFFFMAIGLVLFACGQEQSTESTSEDSAQETSYTYVPLDPILKLDAQVEDSLKEWKSYWELQREMERFRGVKSGDLSYINEDLLRIQSELIHDSIPEKVQNPAVKSRALVFRTFAMKLKDQLEQRAPSAEVDTTRVKLFESYNAFRFHIADALREKVYEDFLKRDTTYLDSILPE
ncbi:hypothetical protein E7Z59_04980 [Robertkochia marina]|uniref:Uncharacterized protein n=1 Tax=Robertkochia marina TaxID=1227945 RepID=A0A4S3M3E2_9FLAO|nr:hypothetical protein [Robertkochia marina]THD69682.1 hypothetical protein E7Z59_04980 [Robertkochia marina]